MMFYYDSLLTNELISTLPTYWTSVQSIISGQHVYIYSPANQCAFEIMDALHIFSVKRYQTILSPMCEWAGIECL